MYLTLLNPSLTQLILRIITLCKAVPRYFKQKSSFSLVCLQWSSSDTEVSWVRLSFLCLQVSVSFLQTGCPVTRHPTEMPGKLLDFNFKAGRASRGGMSFGELWRARRQKLTVAEGAFICLPPASRTPKTKKHSKNCWFLKCPQDGPFLDPRPSFVTQPSFHWLYVTWSLYGPFWEIFHWCIHSLNTYFTEFSPSAKHFAGHWMDKT